ncbi:MAG: hypothetical protein HZB42_04085 [Sphingobacteriales bacterium]|nr:hypothetical protein [Sphingobacteriales bacterium]
MDLHSIAGEYQLQGVREMASGFLLKPDGDFQFFFSYGALDRYGSGKWTTNNSTVIFNSAEKPGQEFALVESKSIDDNGIFIQIIEKNKNLLPYSYASFQKDVQESWTPANGEGMIRFPEQPFSEISLLFEFCPEKISRFSVKDKSHNFFSFRIEPWLAEVFFKNFILTAGNGELKGRHPLLKGDQLLFAKL